MDEDTSKSLWRTTWPARRGPRRGPAGALNLGEFPSSDESTFTSTESSSRALRAADERHNKASAPQGMRGPSPTPLPGLPLSAWGDPAACWPLALPCGAYSELGPGAASPSSPAARCHRSDAPTGLCSPAKWVPCLRRHLSQHGGRIWMVHEHVGWQGRPARCSCPCRCPVLG